MKKLALLLLSLIISVFLSACFDDEGSSRPSHHGRHYDQDRHHDDRHQGDRHQGDRH